MDSSPERRARAESLRYELKAVCEESAYARLVMALRLHPFALRTLFPPRRVQSVYFDTDRNRALEENLAGVSRRTKLRYRWYGDATSGLAGQLERKERENALGWKETTRVAGDIDVEGARRRDFAADVQAGVDGRWRAALAGLDPVQWIAYQREYWTTADGLVRVTLDRDLQAFDLRLAARITSSARTFLPRILILEAKCAPGHHDVARQLIGALPVVVDRCSKFVLASAPGQGPLPSILGD